MSSYKIKTVTDCNEPTTEYYEESIKRVQEWMKLGGPDYIAIHAELKTFWDLGFRAGNSTFETRHSTGPYDIQEFFKIIENNLKNKENVSKHVIDYVMEQMKIAYNLGQCPTCRKTNQRSL